jgi:3'-phosphoadenosine 5'-phosphosulfate sulfotransferase (PAPS reductase)/FAD synthetase
MVLHMIERGDPLDEVMFCDTTMEFPAMIRHVEKVRKVIEAAGIKFTELRAEHDFEYYLTQHEVEGRKPGSAFYGVPGYGWAGHKSRWCTKTLKVGIMERHLRDLQEDFEVIQYIGIAADEDYRMDRKGNQDPRHRHPLRDWGWTEADAMQYCRDRGYDWEGLYDIFDRVSCWCCPLKNYDELRRTRKHFPELWEKLLDLDSRQAKKFQHGYSVADFDLRFRLEDALTAAGHRINSLSFFVDLKRLLAGEVTIDEILRERNIAN